MTWMAGALFGEFAGADSPDLRVDGRLSPGETAVESLDVVGTVRIVVEQDGIDLVAVLRSADSAVEEGIEFDSPLRDHGTDSAVITASESDRWTLELRAFSDGVPAGRFRVLAESLATASAARLEAEEAWTRASIAYALGRRREKEAPSGRGTSEAFSASATAFAAASSLFGDLGLWGRAASSSHAEATVARRLGRLEDASHAYLRAIEQWRQADDRVAEGRSWNDLGLVKWQLGDFDEASQYFDRAWEHLAPFADPNEELAILQNRCLILHSRGQLESAVDCYSQARNGFAALGNRREAATVSNNLGYAFHAQGEPVAAISSYDEALKVRRALEDRVGVAQTLNNLAVVYRSVGELQAALDLYDEARRLQRDLGARRQEAATLNNIGLIYEHLGDAARARVYFEQVIDAWQALGDRTREIRAIGHWSRLLCENGEAQEGLAHLRVAINSAKGLERASLDARLHVWLGRCLAQTRQFEDAVKAFEQALQRLEATGDNLRIAAADRLLALSLLDLDRAADALPRLEKSLLTELDSGDRTSVVLTRIGLARAYRALGRLAEARDQSVAALEEIESLRQQIAHPESRSTFLGAQRDAYEILAQVLVDLHTDHGDQNLLFQAFEVSERARARTLLDLLQRSGADASPGLDPALLDERQDLRRRLYAKAERRARKPKPGPSSAGAAGLSLEIVEIERQLDAIEARLRSQSRRYAAWLEPSLPSLVEVRELLGPDTVLLEFLLGEEGGLLWRIDSQTLSVHELPGRASIEDDVLELYLAWSRPGAAPESDHLARRLAKTLLGPVWRDLVGSDKTRLAIAADGALHLLPFAALPAPDGSPRIWLDRFEIVGVGSATALAAERRRRDSRREEKSASSRTLILADPVFEASDRRVQNVDARSSRDEDSGAEPRYNRLSFSLGEAQAVAALAPSGFELKVGFEARADRLRSDPLQSFRFLHLASHGVVDLEHPSLSGLLLSRVDVRGQSVPGWLRLREIYDLELQAELVVLSACRTAVGRQVRGEGVLSLARGFIHAGSRSVAASLWAVQDRATAELMASMYRHLWHAGASPSAALRLAQLELRQRRRWSAPFYWAPWVLQGDWQ